MVSSFFLPFFQRILSGAASYFGYSNKIVGMLLISLLMVAYPFIAPIPNAFFIAFYIVNIIVVGMKFMSFDPEIGGVLSKFRDIHLWESLVTGGYMVYLTLTGHNILLLICSVYPSLIIHKGLINLGSKLNFFAEATNDPTGKTYNIPILKLNIPRSSTKFRLILAGISIVAAVYIATNGLSYTIDWFK